jgi:hypothetical protein
MGEDMSGVNKMGKPMRRAIRLGLAALFAGGGLGALHAAEAAVACDATTGASCKVVGVRTTKTSATVSWTEGRHNGQRYFCYGIGTASKCAQVTSRASGVKNQVTAGLTPNTVYAYKFYGTYYGGQLSIVKGTFKTDSSSCGTTVVTTVEVNGTVLTSTRDSLENVVATITRKSDGMVMDKDTSDRSGGYHFEVDPGTYTVALSYPPFTAPAPYTATVVISKPLTIPDQVMTGAFQVGARMVAVVTGDSLPDVTVTVRRKSDNSVVGTRVTDFRGHFSFGLTAGDYLLDATYQGKAMASSLAFTVSKSGEMPDILMAYADAIRLPGAARPRWNGFAPPRIVDAKGARITRPASAGAIFPAGEP